MTDDTSDDGSFLPTDPRDTTDPDCPNPDHACVGLDDLPLGLEWLGLCRIPP